MHDFFRISSRLLYRDMIAKCQFNRAAGTTSYAINVPWPMALYSFVNCVLLAPIAVIGFSAIGQLSYFDQISIASCADKILVSCVFCQLVHPFLFAMTLSRPELEMIARCQQYNAVIIPGGRESV